MMSPNSRVWIYTCNRAMTQQETEYSHGQLTDFCHQWTAHNQALKASVEIRANQIVILTVDESLAGASGCSIDKSVRFLENLGQTLSVDFFERMRFGWLDDTGQLQVADKLQFLELLEQGTIHADTLVADTLVQTKQKLDEQWLIPYGKSWVKRVV